MSRSPREPRPTGRVVAAAVAIALLLAAAVGYVAYAAHRQSSAAGGGSGAGSSAADVARVTSAGPYYVFKSSALDGDFSRLVVASAASPSTRAFVGGLKCRRVAFDRAGGLCLQQSQNLVGLSVDAVVLDGSLRETGHVTLPGYPSRTQLSPDGRLAAATTFVSGDSYATIGFSTRTAIIDLAQHRVLFDLESLAVTKDGTPFHAADFNFWGVTFEADGRHFYATLGSGGRTYLVHGDVDSRTATVVTTGVECPSLSPDGRFVAFKKRAPGSRVSWTLWVLDLQTGRQHATAETRPVDDQAYWLDDHTLMYGLAAPESDQQGNGDLPPAIAAGASIDADMWAVPADGTGAPRLVLAHAWSAQIVR